MIRTFGIFALGFGIALAGDATHVASGTTEYHWDLPAIWKSAFWFPFAVGAAVTAAAWAAERFGPPPRKTHSLVDVVLGAAAVLALYALTAVVHSQPPTVSVVLTGAIAVAIWAWWDPSPRAFAVATIAAVAGPLAEAAIVSAGAASYAPDADGLLGVGEWLPCLYFAAGAVASGLWRAVRAP
jgi:hypothetical protein